MSADSMSADPMSVKRALLEHCQAYVSRVLSEAHSGVERSREAANMEEKSSAGDKFETQRAMMHLQMESFIERLEVARRLEAELALLRIQPMDTVELGALVELEGRAYFVAVSAPVCAVDGVRYTCLSREAPLFLAMRGLREGDWVEWGGEDEELELTRVR